jgi:hypothetical protein
MFPGCCHRMKKGLQEGKKTIVNDLIWICWLVDIYKKYLYHAKVSLRGESYFPGFEHFWARGMRPK